jgi:hypothetical protein
MALLLPDPPHQVAQVISSRLDAVSGPERTGPSALGGSDPTSLTLTDPHEVYVLGLDDLLREGDALASARLTGWRYMLRDRGQVIAAASTALTEAETHRFALFNRGPYVEGTVDGLRTASQLPAIQEGRDMTVRLLTVPALNLTALWLHDDGEDLLLPLAPAPGTVEAGRPSPAHELLATLREPARQLSSIGREDETGS